MLPGFFMARAVGRAIRKSPLKALFYVRVAAPTALIFAPLHRHFFAYLRKPGLRFCRNALPLSFDL
ncbi:MAG: hypothetical protein EPO19_12795 [Betaproteobacteria bacterium]|nr:MAG: hypothetical protein EPO19_12795 [Betaproteobacteria bacterium]